MSGVMVGSTVPVSGESRISAINSSTMSSKSTDITINLTTTRGAGCQWRCWFL